MSEIKAVQVTRYEYDGVEYDSRREAERARARWQLTQLLDEHGAGLGGTWSLVMFQDFMEARVKDLIPILAQFVGPDSNKHQVQFPIAWIDYNVPIRSVYLDVGGWLPPEGFELIAIRSAQKGEWTCPVIEFHELQPNLVQAMENHHLSRVSLIFRRVADKIIKPQG